MESREVAAATRGARARSFQGRAGVGAGGPSRRGGEQGSPGGSHVMETREVAAAKRAAAVPASLSSKKSKRVWFRSPLEDVKNITPVPRHQPDSNKPERRTDAKIVPMVPDKRAALPEFPQQPGAPVASSDELAKPPLCRIKVPMMRTSPSVEDVAVEVGKKTAVRKGVPGSPRQPDAEVARPDVAARPLRCKIKEIMSRRSSSTAEQAATKVGKPPPYRVESKVPRLPDTALATPDVAARPLRCKIKEIMSRRSSSTAEQAAAKVGKPPPHRVESKFPRLSNAALTTPDVAARPLRCKIKEIMSRRSSSTAEQAAAKVGKPPPLRVETKVPRLPDAALATPDVHGRPPRSKIRTLMKRPPSAVEDETAKVNKPPPHRVESKFPRLPDAALATPDMPTRPTSSKIKPPMKRSASTGEDTAAKVGKPSIYRVEPRFPSLSDAAIATATPDEPGKPSQHLVQLPMMREGASVEDLVESQTVPKKCPRKVRQSKVRAPGPARLDSGEVITPDVPATPRKHDMLEAAKDTAPRAEDTSKDPAKTRKRFRPQCTCQPWLLSLSAGCDVQPPSSRSEEQAATCTGGNFLSDVADCLRNREGDEPAPTLSCASSLLGQVVTVTPEGSDEVVSCSFVRLESFVTTRAPPTDPGPEAPAQPLNALNYP
ncbi:adhesive plaque matrix protein-like isoform X2 [Bacillus rossius redtenbacheri]